MSAAAVDPQRPELSARQVNCLIAQQHRLRRLLDRHQSWPVGAGPWRDIVKDTELELRELLAELGIEATK